MRAARAGGVDVKGLRAHVALMAVAVAVAVSGAGAPRVQAQRPPQQPSQQPPAPPPAGGMAHTPGMTHMPGMEHPTAPPTAQPTQGGQAAFATIAEIVRLLEADSTTDWKKVDLEALRQHLIDMDAVTMRARAGPTTLPAGLTIDVTGDASVSASIRRMLGLHAPMLDAMSGWHATAVPIPGGARLTVVARDTSDRTTIAHIRGLGFIGLMVQGEHHPAHHLMIARGDGAAAHAPMHLMR
jgi:hypothetical protein